MKEGNKVIVVASLDAYSEKLTNCGCIFIAINLDRSGVNLVKEVSTLKSFIKIYQGTRPSCVLNFTPKVNIYSTIAAKLLKIPSINNVAGLGSIFTEKGYKSWLGKFLLRVTQPLASHTVFQNTDDLSTYVKHGFVSKNKTSKVNGIGIDLKVFKSCEAPDDNFVRFILVARMLKNKGVIEFVQAASRVKELLQLRTLSGNTIPKLEFSLLGFVDSDNPQAIHLTQLNSWHEKELINYLGVTDNVFEIVKSYDCVVLPSYYREGVPQCLIEAAAMAKPIITTDNVGCRDTVEQGVSGVLVRPRSISELADAMLAVIDMGHNKRIEMGNNGRKKAEREFCHLKVSRHYQNLIEQFSKD